MELGFCTGIDNAAKVMEWGFDYIEVALAPLAQQSEEEFQASLEQLKASGLPCRACNIFLPGTVKVTGPAYDRTAAAAYAETALERASRLGARIVVFGSSGARTVPAGFSASRALDQLLDFSRLAAEAAVRHSVTLVLEPLCANETNLINRVSEGLLAVKAVNHPGFKLLADHFHMLVEQEDLRSIAQAGDELRHVHIATLPGRKIPLEGDATAAGQLVAALKAIGYNGGLSIEGGHREDLEAEAGEAQRMLRRLVG